MAGEVGGAVVSFCDWLFNTGPDAPEGPSPAQTAGGLLNTVIPGAGAILSGAGGLWALIRGGKWKKAFVATADVIEKATAAGKITPEMKKDLAVAHSAAGVKTIVDRICTRYDEDPEVVPPAASA